MMTVLYVCCMVLPCAEQRRDGTDVSQKIQLKGSVQRILTGVETRLK
jgi:hypothetical protein